MSPGYKDQLHQEPSLWRWSLSSVSTFFFSEISLKTLDRFSPPTDCWLCRLHCEKTSGDQSFRFSCQEQDSDLILRWFTFQCESSQIPNEALSKTTLIFRLYGWNRSRKRRRVRLVQDCCIHLCTTGACTNHVHTVRFTLNTACKPVSITSIFTWSWLLTSFWPK